VCILGQCPKVSDAVERAPGSECVAEREGAQSCEATRAAAVDGKPGAISLPLGCKMLGTGTHVVDVDNAPAAAQSAPVFLAVARRTSIVD
jgi:hypothetical protein